MSYVLVVVGVAMLYAGGELLVRNAALFARRVGVSSLLIGFTVVAFGTSSPELAATLVSNLIGSPEIAVGNVIGSNIANIGLILGLSALIYPLTSRRRFVWREVPIMAGLSCLLLPAFWDGALGRLEGLALLALLAVYLIYLFRTDRDAASMRSEVTAAATERAAWVTLLFAGIGVLLLTLGARALVSGGVALAEGFGVSERIIGLTLVAVGTSLPEFAASIVAAARREPDIILGNIVGSNVFNVLGVLGVTALAQPLAVSLSAIQWDLIVMLAFSLAVVPLMARSLRLGRAGGAIILGLYALYLALLFA